METAKETNLIKKNILGYLYDNYGICEMDFSSAEIEVVPAFKAKDVGLDLKPCWSICTG
jgi:aspartyl aminopeptidase